MRSHLLLFLFICSATFPAFSQSDESEGRNQATSLKPYYPSEEKLEKREKLNKRNSMKTNVDLQQEYYDRVEAVMKERKRAARLMEKPQYSDPMYFGHKRPPKKHSPKKMRYCKECGIRH